MARHPQEWAVDAQKVIHLRRAKCEPDEALLLGEEANGSLAAVVRLRTQELDGTPHVFIQVCAVRLTAQGRGYGREAIERALSHAAARFTHAQTMQVEGLVHMHNTAMQHILSSYGLRVGGIRGTRSQPYEAWEGVIPIG